MTLDASGVARYGLPGVEHAPEGPPSPAEWSNLLRSVAGQRLTGLLVAMVVDGVLELTAAQEDQLVDEHRAALARDLLVERAVLSAVALLDAAGLDHRVLKGTAVAHLDHGDPALRSFVDADILVRSDEWDEAVSALERGGSRRDSHEPRPGWDRRFAKCATFSDAAGFEVDLHRTFVFGPAGFTVRLDDLWSSSQPFTLGGQRLRALDAEARWLHACYTAALDSPARLVTLRDIVKLAAGGGLDVARVVERAGRWEAAGIVRRGAQLCAGTLGARVPGELGAWAEGLGVTAREEARLRAYTDPGDRYVRLTIATLRAVHGLPAKAAYAAGLLWPSRSYIEYRYGSRRRRFEKVVRRAVRAAGEQRHALRKGSAA